MQDTQTITNFTVTEKVLEPNHSQIVIEPLDQGYGHTLGNALRRVLLSSLPGTAFTSVIFANVDHQFSTIPGVKEDVLEITLNLKQISLNSSTETGGVARLSVSGPKKVTAADLVCEAGLEVVSPDQHIATLAKGSKLELELTSERGLGYTLAKDRQTNTIGEIMLDSLFSPVVKVSYKVEETRVGRRTDYDKLILDVTTTGSIKPMDAVKRAAKILQKQFAQVVDPVVAPDVEPVEALSPELQEVMRLTVEELDLPTRIANALRKGGFETVGHLTTASRDTIAKVKNLGEKSVDVVQHALEKKGAGLAS